MYSRLETFVDEPRAFALLWIKLSELAIHASFTREFSPATRPFPPLAFLTLSLSLSLSFLFFRFTSRHQRPGQIRIHCRISLERLLEERGNLLLPPSSNFFSPRVNERGYRYESRDRLLRISCDFSWFLLSVPPSPRNFHSRLLGSSFKRGEIRRNEYQSNKLKHGEIRRWDFHSILNWNPLAKNPRFEESFSLSLRI